MTVNQLVNAKNNSATVAYQAFVLLSSHVSNDLFCFFEGKDAPYYHLRIKLHYQGVAHYIKCGGKSTVIKVHKLINYHKEYDKFKRAFFIDKDYDRSIKNQYHDIYETPSYSIENLYCSVSSFEEFIKTDLGIGADLQEYVIILQLYQGLLNDFLNASLLFNAWYKLQKEKSETSRVPNNVSLEDSLIPTYIKLTLTSVQADYDLSKIVSNFPSAINVTSDEILKKTKEIQKENLPYYIRGKYILRFMTQFIRVLLLDGIGAQTILKKKVRYNMDNSQALTLLTVYAETPRCLKDFIGKYN